MRNVLLALLPVTLSACAYVSPMVGTVRTPRGDGTGPMPLLAAAITDVDARITELEKKRNQTLITGRLLDLLTFGFASSATYAALVGNHTKTVTNAAFGAGLSYAGTSLFAAPDVANVYNSGATAMACIANRGAALRTAVVRHQAQVEKDDADTRLDNLLADCAHDAKDVAAAQAAQDKAKRVLAYAAGADAEEASRVRQAANGVAAAVNREVLKRSNSPDAIFAAAKSLTARATGTVIEGKAPQQGLTPKAGAVCTPEHQQRLREFASNYAEIDKAITGAVNAMAALDTSCVLETAATEALTLSQEEVTVTKDATVRVLISGGRPPYTLVETGTATKDVSVALIQPRTIVVTGLSTITGSKKGPFDTQVRDNSVITTPKTLKVFTQ